MKKKKKGLAIGNSDFKEIIQENGYYVDKTKFIEDLLEDLSKVKLFTRPRRFGKTLNLSMLKYFFDVRNAEENRKLFDNLYISKGVKATNEALVEEAKKIMKEYDLVPLTPAEAREKLNLKNNQGGK